jgi:hypothetical protein
MKKKRMSWTIKLSVILLSASAVTYFIHYLIFHDVHHIFIYMIGDFGFLFLDVLLVVLLIERLLSQREKRIMMKKLNMVIGAFFSEVGLSLLEVFFDFVEDAPQLEEKVDIQTGWSQKDFRQAIKEVRRFPFRINYERKDLIPLRDFLISKREFLLRLLENPHLLEHESFTDLLWAVFHLTEELEFRGNKLAQIPDSDYKHLCGDLKRVYSHLIQQWLLYVAHLKESYPFLFSLAQRINPLNPKASVIVTS